MSALLDAPLPPVGLMRRVGGMSEEQMATDYIRIGADSRDVVLARIPDDWSMAGRRILDFGSGAGRTLRHFDPEREAGTELWGCDIDGPSIAWAQENLPGINFLLNGEEPPLDVPDAHFDVIYAISVFTHITSHWADWLIEMHRILRPEGVLICTFLGKPMYEDLLDTSYSEEEVGMLTVRAGYPWDEGGPYTFHSPWWLKAHWGPAFDSLRIEDDVLGGHGVVVARRAAAPPSREVMLAVDPGESREAVAALHNVRLLYGELEEVRRDARWATSERESQLAALSAELGEIQALLVSARQTLDATRRSASWRVTAPLRRAKQSIKRIRCAGRR